jgi:hypothetical protein
MTVDCRLSTLNAGVARVRATIAIAMWSGVIDDASVVLGRAANGSTMSQFGHKR